MCMGVLITARLGSTRLKSKHLLNINGKPILLYLVKRIKAAFLKEIEAGKIAIVIATSDEQENRQFEMFRSHDVSIFYGSQCNIPLRHLQAAKEYRFDSIISVDGDDILCSVEGMRQVYHELECGKEFIKTSGLPFGMNVTGYKTGFLDASLHNAESEVLETGWGRIFDESKLTIVNFNISHCNEYMRFTLDYPEDFMFFEKLITKFPSDLESCSDQKIVDYVESKQLYEITKTIAKEYWINFHNGVEKETIKEER